MIKPGDECTSAGIRYVAVEVRDRSVMLAEDTGNGDVLTFWADREATECVFASATLRPPE